MLKKFFKEFRKMFIKKHFPLLSEDAIQVWIDIEDFEVLCFEVAKGLYLEEEIIPPFDTRYQGKLESCLNQPLQTYGEIDLYPSIIDKIAILYYLLIKNHPFQNGNKRIATVSLLVFCWANGLNFEPNNDQIKGLALRVAESDPKEKDSCLDSIKKFIIKHINKNFKIESPKSFKEFKQGFLGIGKEN